MRGQRVLFFSSAVLAVTRENLLKVEAFDSI